MYKCYLTGIWISIIKMRWSNDHLIFIMEIAIPGKMVFILKWGLDVCTLQHRACKIDTNLDDIPWLYVTYQNLIPVQAYITYGNLWSALTSCLRPWEQGHMTSRSKGLVTQPCVSLVLSPDLCQKWQRTLGIYWRCQVCMKSPVIITANHVSIKITCFCWVEYINL